MAPKPINDARASQYASSSRLILPYASSAIAWRASAARTRSKESKSRAASRYSSKARSESSACTLRPAAANAVSARRDAAFEAGSSAAERHTSPATSGESRVSTFKVSGSPARTGCTNVMTPKRSTGERARTPSSDAVMETPWGTAMNRIVPLAGALAVSSASPAPIKGWQRGPRTREGG
ncbi:MAG: hypothetical protein WDO56_23075 [Gammaproteobacteria bacterium]